MSASDDANQRKATLQRRNAKVAALQRSGLVWYVNCPVTGRAAPVRTCVGCRARAAKSDLLRVVAIDGVGVVDLHGKLPGRGAHLHPDLACLDLAERRRAFPRALKVPGTLDLSALRQYVEAQVQAGKADDQLGRVTDERSMSTQR